MIPNSYFNLTEKREANIHAIAGLYLTFTISPILTLLNPCLFVFISTLLTQLKNLSLFCFPLLAFIH